MDKIVPRVTIITVVYNSVDYIEETIQNILNQIYTNIEYIVIDGGSTDGTIDILRKYEKQLDFFISEKDQGIYDAMNKGINLATGDWINFINAGDRYTEIDSIYRFIYPLNSLKSINFIYSDYLLDNIKIIQKYSILTFFRKNICHQSIFYHKSLFKDIKFDINLRYAADYKHIIDNYYNIKPLKRNDYLVKYDSSGVSSDKANFYKIWYERFIALKGSNFPIIIKSSFMLYSYILYSVRKYIGK